MPACGGTHHAHVIRIDVITYLIRAQPPNRRLTILNLRRKQGLLAEAIFHTGHDIASRRHGRHRARILAAASPSATVNMHNQRQGMIRRWLRKIDV